MLSVLINTYNRPDRLERCLEALSWQFDAPDCEVIVVDDGGSADLSPLLQRYQSRLPLRIERISHAGRSAARNKALELARGERVLFLGDDVIVQSGLLARHAAEGDPNIAVVGPYPLASNAGSPPFRRWAEPNPQHEIENHENAGPFYFATGNLSASREKLLQIGGFDERFQKYGWEDIDLGLRFERAGGRIRFDPSARAVHDHPIMSRNELWERERQMGFTAFQFYSKWKVAEPKYAEKMKFWHDPRNLPAPNPIRREIGKKIISLLDLVAPGSSVNWKAYERMIFSHRFEGVRAAWKFEGEA